MKTIIKKIEWAQLTYQWRNWLDSSAPKRIRKALLRILPEFLVYDPLPDFENGEDWPEWTR